MTDTRSLATHLRTKVITDPAFQLGLRNASLRAAFALQVMSDRNFNQAPQSVKQMCSDALRDCERAWSEHGAHMKG